jgi:sulfate transport system substrate-binding protein
LQKNWRYAASIFQTMIEGLLITDRFKGFFMRFSQVKVGVIAALLSVSSFAAQEFLNVSYSQTHHH